MRKDLRRDPVLNSHVSGSIFALLRNRTDWHITPERIRRADAEAEQWLIGGGRDYRQSYFSPFAKIDKRNVPQPRRPSGLFRVLLGCFAPMAWQCASGSSDNQSTPNTGVATVYAGGIETESVRRLSFGRAGRITSINVQAGRHVRRGQLLASLACADALADLAIAEAERDLLQISLKKRMQLPAPTELHIAKNRLALAEADLRAAEARQRRLEDISRKSDAISMQELESASRRTYVALDVSTAQQGLERLQRTASPLEERENAAREKIHVAYITRARHQLALCDVVAPVGGTVTTIERRPGEYVVAYEPVIHVIDGDQD